MNVSELITELQKLPEDLIVVVEADHGQTAMKASWVGDGKVESLDEHMMESLEDSDPDGVMVAMIQAY